MVSALLTLALRCEAQDHYNRSDSVIKQILIWLTGGRAPSTELAEHILLAGYRGAFVGQPMPMTPVGFAIKLAEMGRTRVIPSCRRSAPGFLHVPLAIWVVPANNFVGLVPAWNAFGSEAEAGTSKQDNKRSEGEEVLHRC